ncbi:MAG TPA: DinB family protein [Actinomycetota bacterium]|nr:DinB family protein [Actinomycetota bacterium]
MQEHRAPDPIADPQGYQRYLLELLGEDDPAEVQERTPAAWWSLLDAAGPGVRARPDGSEWSALECFAHSVDAEVVMSARYRWILAQDQPPLIGYDQDLWADRLHRPVEPVEELTATFAALRAANVALWRRTPQELRARVGMHAERGPESYDLSFRMIAGHDRFHLAQARRALDAAG